MISKILDWCFGYNLLENYEDLVIPQNATHVISIKGDDFITVRKYKDNFIFNNILTKHIVLTYNNHHDVIYDNIYTNYTNLTLHEFIHLVLPNQEFEVRLIPIDYYITGDNHPVETYYYIKDSKYICQCDNDAEKCNFHKFLIENLNKKYI